MTHESMTPIENWDEENWLEAFKNWAKKIWAEYNQFDERDDAVTFLDRGSLISAFIGFVLFGSFSILKWGFCSTACIVIAIGAFGFELVLTPVVGFLLFKNSPSYIDTHRMMDSIELEDLGEVDKQNSGKNFIQVTECSDESFQEDSELKF